MTPHEIHAIREAADMTREQFAVYIGASFPSVGKWERGDSAPLPVFAEKIKKLAEEVGHVVE